MRPVANSANVSGVPMTQSQGRYGMMAVRVESRGSRVEGQKASGGLVAGLAAEESAAEKEAGGGTAGSAAEIVVPSISTFCAVNVPF